MLDYHVHLWPHEDRADSQELRLERLARYCEQAGQAGVREIAVTEHLFRFVEAKELIGPFWADDPNPAIAAQVGAYWDRHATASLDDYVECVLAAKESGLPLVLGLEVDYYAGRMDEVSALLGGYPFDVLLGSVHWIGNWMFDVVEDEAPMLEWERREVGEVWRSYTEAVEELAATGACDVLAHPDLVKLLGHRPPPALRDECEERMAEAAAQAGIAAELSSAGWRKPVGEQYPAVSLLEKFKVRDVPLTTASDTHGTAWVADRAADLRQLAFSAGYEQLRAFDTRKGYDVEPRGRAVTAPVTTPLELASPFTLADATSRRHLERLMATWGLLADLSFSDLLLYVPLDQVRPAIEAEQAALRLVVLGQIRPTTSPTLLELDLVGQVVAASAEPLVVSAFTEGVITRGMERDQVLDDQAEVQCIPVRHHGQVLAVLRRTFLPSVGRRRGQLERTYLNLFDRIAAMVAEGIFPFVNDDAAIEEAPRVGDGVMIVDESSRIVFASPNAVSALHRMGIRNMAIGVTLESLGIDTSAVEQAFSARHSAIDELERHGEVVVLFRCLPLLDSGDITGALLLVRDVTDLRRRDRLLLSKDAAIREVHHRVKNNLQTITSLLRIQARRLGPGRGHDALSEAERRVRSIAIVHELLSRESGDQVPFDEIVHSLVRMAKEANVTGRPMSLRVAGDAGRVSTDIATPLAVVLAELLQNAVEHAFVTPPLLEPTASSWLDGADEVRAQESARVDLVFRHDPRALRVEVRDNGVGFPKGFDAGESDSLGLAIVRDLVRTQLDGIITFANENGTVVRLEVPLRARPAKR